MVGVSAPIGIQADVNAASNVLAAGLAVIACGEVPMGISMKQEPTNQAILVA